MTFTHAELVAILNGIECRTAAKLSDLKSSGSRVTPHVLQVRAELDSLASARSKVLGMIAQLEVAAGGDSPIRL